MNASETSETSSSGYVNSAVVARRYGVTGRYILQLAASGKIPHIRLGAKCVRFNEADVAAVLERGVNSNLPTEKETKH